MEFTQHSVGANGLFVDGHVKWYRATTLSANANNTSANPDDDLSGNFSTQHRLIGPAALHTAGRSP